MSVKLSAIATRPGTYRHSHAAVAGFLRQQQGDVAARKYAMLSRSGSVSEKRSVLPDFGMPESRKARLYAPEDPFPDTARRMEIYRSEAVPLATDVAQDSLRLAGWHPEMVTHLITVSCTGLTAPGLECLLSESLGLPRDIDRHTVNFMGCYAAFHGLRLAHLICSRAPEARVLMVCVELCSLHFQRKQDHDNLRSMYLFNDGAAACVVSRTPLPGPSVLSLHAFASALLPAGSGDMSWNVAAHGFEMVLSKRVPSLLGANIAETLDRQLSDHFLKRDDIRHFAIHPGGRDILHSFLGAVGLPADQLSIPFRILHDFGNMSSATILFVLAGLLERQPPPPGPELVYAAAFGPGLTIESALLWLEPNRPPRNGPPILPTTTR
jgi:predicted naringenin-chalcone synthase